MSELGSALSSEFCRLEELTLRNCKIGDVGFSKLNKQIRLLSSITILDLSSCDLSNAAVVMLTDTLRTKSLQGIFYRTFSKILISYVVTGETWADNLRGNSPRSGSIKQLGRIVLNRNSKIQNSIVELLKALSGEEVTCVEELEIRECGITADAQVNQVLADLLHDPPPKLKLFDIR